MLYAGLIVLASWLVIPTVGAYGAPSGAELSVAVAELERSQMAPVYAFLKDGADPNARNKSGFTLLDTAVNWNHRDVVKTLLERGADPNQCPPPHACPVFLAASRDTEILRLLVAAGAAVNRPTGKFEYTPLGIAAGTRPETFESLRRSGHYRGPSPDALESVRILIAAGADVNHVDSSGVSVLRTAMRVNNLDIARALLEAGADVHHRLGPERGFQMGDTILMETIGWYSLFKDLSAIRLLLDRGAEPNDRDEQPYEDDCEHRGGCDWRGYSALTFAAKRGLYGLVKLLLDRGANPSLPRTDGRTALELAKENKRPQTAALLERYLARKTGSP
jgi:ankyrin repeat protein